MENKKSFTAVDWLKKELEGYGSPSSLNVDWETFDKLIEQAKDMEIEEKVRLIKFSKEMCSADAQVEYIIKEYNKYGR